MKIMLTGGAGFIGSAVAREIVHSSDDSVVVVDNLSYSGNLANLEIISKSTRFWFERADICSPGEIRNILRKYRPDAIMHLAAESHVDRSIDSPAPFIQTNILGTFNLLEETRSYLSSASIATKENFRFLHISTDEVFGDLPHPDENPNANLFTFKEDTAYDPSSPYSASKASSDHLVKAWFKTYDFPSLTTNCSNNYGPYHHPEKLIPHTIINALSGKPIPVYGSGNQIRDWLYVEDHARALLTVLRRGQTGRTYNIGGNNELRNLDVIEKICTLLDKIRPSQRSYKSQVVNVPDRAGHDQRYSINTNRISSELDWSAQETFESGLEKTVNWFVQNDQWWKAILENGYKLSRIGKIK